MSTLTEYLGNIRVFVPVVRYYHLNIEAISIAKSQYLHKILSHNAIEIVDIQKPHTQNDEQLRSKER